MQLRQWQLCVLWVMLGALAVGCGGRATDTPVPTETPVPTQTLTPTRTIVPTETPTPTEAPMSAPADFTQVVLIEESTLGGINATLTIDVDAGTLALEKKDADPVEGELAAGQVEALAALIDEVSFFDFEEDYIPANGTCCDFVYYNIAVTRGGETFNVRASNENMPDGFRAVLTYIQDLKAAAVSSE